MQLNHQARGQRAGGSDEPWPLHPHTVLPLVQVLSKEMSRRPLHKLPWSLLQNSWLRASEVMQTSSADFVSSNLSSSYERL
jgi:hypothetical protein